MKQLTTTMICIMGLLFGSQVFPCAWTYKTKLEANRYWLSELDTGSGSRFLMTVNRRDIMDDLVQKRDALEKQLGVNHDTPLGNGTEISGMNDLAVVLMYLGEPEKSLQLLEKLEQEHPGLYPTAANLGTTYELAGKNEKALEWIKEGIKRNSEAHEGTEWLHVKILEAKIALAGDPHWLEAHHVADLDFGDARKPFSPINFPLNNVAKVQAIKDVRKAIEYQLHERVQFVAPPDPIVADLFFSLGNIYALKDYLESAIRAYEYSSQYGANNAKMIDKRTSYFHFIIRLAAWKEYGSYGATILLTLLAVVGLLWLIIKIIRKGTLNIFAK